MNRVRTNKQSIAYVAILLLVVGNAYIAYRIYWPAPAALHVSVLNIGQGDSILLQGPTGKTILVDGGPDRSVLRELSTELGPLTRHIDMLVETHPDADHITGLIYVLQQYSVSQFMSPGIPDSTETFQKLEATANATKGLQRITAHRGQRLDLGGGAYADVLYPDRDLSKETETNDGSITMHVVYGKTSFMLTGDLPTPLEDWLITLDGADGELKTDVLKAGHHGSRYSTSDEWLASLDPSSVAISVGKNNRYGHPTSEMLSRVQHEGAKIYETEQVGTITFTSDGTTVTEHSGGL